MKSLLRHPTVQAMLARLTGCYLHFALRTTRWRLEGQAEFASVAAGRPTIVTFWHEHLPLMCALPMLGRRLPGYMLPRGFTRLETLPLNANRKVDRRAVAALLADSPAG